MERLLVRLPAAALSSQMSTQPTIPQRLGNRMPACMAGVRRGAFTCVGWQVTLYDPIWQVTSRSSEMGLPWRAISAFTFFTFTLIISDKNVTNEVSFEHMTFVYDFCWGLSKRGRRTGVEQLKFVIFDLAQLFPRYLETCGRLKHILLWKLLTASDGKSFALPPDVVKLWCTYARKKVLKIGGLPFNLFWSDFK